MHPISLESLTVTELTAPEVVSLGAALGCQHVSIFLQQPMRGVGAEASPVVTDPAVRKETKKRLADSGISPYVLEVFPLSLNCNLDSYLPVLECGAELGGKRGTVLVTDLDRNRVLDRFCRLCEMASQFGLGMNTEFVALTKGLKSLREAVDLVTAAKQPNAGILVDSLHLMRTGGSCEELARVDPKLINCSQISDGPLQMPEEKQTFEALKERQIPGQGEFPLAEFVSALPPGSVIGVEVPMESLKEKGVGAMERARMAVEATRRLLATLETR